MNYFRLKESFQVVPLIVAVLLFSSCRIFNHSDEKIVISVGSQNITKAELKEEIDAIAGEMGIPNSEIGQGIASILNKVVEKYLIMEYGKDERIEVTDEELASAINEIKKDYPDEVFKETLLESYIVYDSWEKALHQKLLIEKITEKAIGDINPITFNETQAYYNSHLDDFGHPAMIKLRQIVVNTKEAADTILTGLNEGKDMGELAKKYSITPEAGEGGVMGWLAEGRLEQEIEDILFKLPVGKKSGIIKSSYGYHIFEVMDRQEEGYYSLPEVMDKIETKLTLQKRELSYSKWISDLKDRYPIKIQEDIYTSWDR